MKIWNGTEFVDPTGYKVWNGSAFVDPKETHIWDGTQFVKQWPTDSFLRQSMISNKSYSDARNVQVTGFAPDSNYPATIEDNSIVVSGSGNYQLITTVAGNSTIFSVTMRILVNDTQVYSFSVGGNTSSVMKPVDLTLNSGDKISIRTGGGSAITGNFNSVSLELLPITDEPQYAVLGSIPPGTSGTVSTWLDNDVTYISGGTYIVSRFSGPHTIEASLRSTGSGGSWQTATVKVGSTNVGNLSWSGNTGVRTVSVSRTLAVGDLISVAYNSNYLGIDDSWVKVTKN